MTGNEPVGADSGRDPTAEVRRMLDDLVDRARGGVGEVADPGTQALLETTAEVLTGLRRAYEHHDHGSEEAWREDAGPATRRPDRAPDHTSARAAEAAVDQAEDRR
ncbi:hypothetical protein BH20ACT9_BH20ACT9_01170 [soil metagenome]